MLAEPRALAQLALCLAALHVYAMVLGGLGVLGAFDLAAGARLTQALGAQGAFGAELAFAAITLALDAAAGDRLADRVECLSARAAVAVPVGIVMERAVSQRRSALLPFCSGIGTPLVIPIAMEVSADLIPIFEQRGARARRFF